MQRYGKPEVFLNVRKHRALFYKRMNVLQEIMSAKKEKANSRAGMLC